MDVAVPHRGRKLQTNEIFAAMWMGNCDCVLNCTLLHHLEALGWRFTD